MEKIKKFTLEKSSALLDKICNVCSNPLKVTVFFAICLALFYTIQCALLQDILGLDVLETISWGAQGAMGHAKHPPLSGWLSYAVSALGNHRDWIMYLAAQSCLVISVVYVYKCTALFFDKYAAGVAALLCYFTFYYNPSETRFCTYPLEMMLIPVCCYNFFRALQENKLISWLAVGFFCAAGILNKYSFGLVMTALAIIFFADKRNWKLLKSYKPYLAAVLMLLLLGKHLQWLWENDFICFKHVGSRLAEEHHWYTPLVTLATAIYPYAMMAAILMLAWVPDFRNNQRIVTDKRTAINALLIAAVPALTIVVISITQGVIMMWFCSMAAFAAIALTAFFPWKIDRRFFSRVVVMLVIFSSIMMVATSLDLMLKSRPRIHSDPQSYTLAAQNFYQKFSLKPIPVVVGTRYEATLLENYLPHRPPACEINDPVFLARYREKILREGALLIAPVSKKAPTPENIFGDFFKEIDANINDIEFIKITYPYKALLGKKRTRTFYLGFLPPQKVKIESK